MTRAYKSFPAGVVVPSRQILGGLGRSPDEKDVEIAVLRRQIAVLHRHVLRPRFNPADPLLLAPLA